MHKMLTIGTDRLRLKLHEPEDGFYRGTRFDRSGVFDSLLFGGVECCGRWFGHYDPLMHDAVCGPAEEFSLFPVPGREGVALKIGVGLLAMDGMPYDRFRLYPVIDPGSWTVEEDPGCVRFRHILEGFYAYKKEVALTGPASFSIRHRLVTEIPFQGEVYNHNFFTLGKLAVGPQRQIDFPFCPEGHWRAVYDSVSFQGNGIRFSRQLAEGESVYTGDIREKGKTGMPYRMTLREGPLSVFISGSVPVTRTVLWANHRVACLEPYNRLPLRPGESFHWALDYRFSDGPANGNEALPSGPGN